MPSAELGPISDYSENEPAKASGGGRDFVVVRRGESAFVLDHACQHLGAPMSDGLVEGDTLVCPWHRAVYALGTGALLEPPGCNQQRAYRTEVQDGILIASWEEDEAPHPAPPMASAGSDKRRFGILGAGAAGLTAAEALREYGFEGEIVLVDGEESSPYDRTKLSKGLVEEDEVPRLRGERFLAQHDISPLRATVTAIDLPSRTLQFDEGEDLQCDGLILAPGAEPRRLDLPGADLQRVVTLRSAADALMLKDYVQGAKRAAVIGSGFIGMELATVLRNQDLPVTMVARDEVPFEKILGEQIGRRLRREQEEAGVTYAGGAEIEEFEGEEQVRAVNLKDGRRIEADLVVMAVGVSPRTELLNVEKEKDGGIVTDAALRLPDVEGVVLAGDIAHLPTPWGPIRVEHWRWAQQLGRLAARSLLGQDAAYEGAPFFWTKQQAPGSYVYFGHAEGFDEIRYEGEPDDGKDFAAYYLKDGRVMAVFGHGMTDSLSALERRMAREGPLPAEVAANASA